MPERTMDCGHAWFQACQILTERLVLRRLGTTDAARVLEYRSLPEVSRFQHWEPQSVDDVRSFINQLPDRFAPGTWFQLGVALRDSETLVGDCGVHVLETDDRQAEVGISLDPGFQGKGYASEAMKAVLDLLFLQMGKHRVFGSVDPHNHSSIALMRRLGMRQEAHFVRSLWFKGDWADDLVFAILADEWRASKRVLVPGVQSYLIEAMTPADWPEVAAIYRQGIEEGLSTFETEVPSWHDWDLRHHQVCRLVARSASEVLGWAALSPVSTRGCYRGVAEVSVYVATDARRHGLGRALLEGIVAASETAGIWTLQGATFEENRASLRLQKTCGFRVVGYRERVAQRRGRWHTTVLTERRSRRVGQE